MRLPRYRNAPSPKSVEIRCSKITSLAKPGGDFLLMVIANDTWNKLVFGPLLAHGGTRAAEWWIGTRKKQGFKFLRRVIVQ
jgi:hypothetical protein